MHRRGDRAEKWLAEHIEGSATTNSGAKYEDGDWRGIYRLYEVKEREVDNAIVVNSKAVNKHIPRAHKEALGAAFMVMTKDAWVYFIVPAEDYILSMQAVGMDPAMFQSAPGIVSKRGQNIKVNDEIVKEFRKHGIFLWKYGRKGIDVWAIVEADHWLEVCGEARDVRPNRSNLSR